MLKGTASAGVAKGLIRCYLLALSVMVNLALYGGGQWVRATSKVVVRSSAATAACPEQCSLLQFGLIGDVRWKFTTNMFWFKLH